MGAGAEAERREPDAADVEAEPAVEPAVAQRQHTEPQIVVAEEPAAAAQPASGGASESAEAVAEGPSQVEPGAPGAEPAAVEHGAPEPGVAAAAQAGADAVEAGGPAAAEHVDDAGPDVGRPADQHESELVAGHAAAEHQYECHAEPAAAEPAAEPGLLAGHAAAEPQELAAGPADAEPDAEPGLAESEYAELVAGHTAAEPPYEHYAGPADAEQADGPRRPEPGHLADRRPAADEPGHSPDAEHQVQIAAQPRRAERIVPVAEPADVPGLQPDSGPVQLRQLAESEQHAQARREPDYAYPAAAYQADDALHVRTGAEGARQWQAASQLSTGSAYHGNLAAYQAAYAAHAPV